MTITTASLRGEPSHGWSKKTDENKEEAAKASAQDFLNNVPNTLTVTDFQVKAANKFRNKAYEANSTHGYAYSAMTLAAASGRVNDVVADIVRGGFDSPDANEEKATVLVRAAAHAIVSATLVLDDMGYNVEKVLEGVLHGRI